MRRAVANTVLVLALAACGSTDEAEQAAPPPLFGDSPPPVPDDPAAQARHLFATSCATCHGARGGGDGGMAARMSPPPRDHGDPTWQAAVTDAQIAAIIVGGGAALGKSPNMPARPDLARQPEVLAELVALIRSFKR